MMVRRMLIGVALGAVALPALAQAPAVQQPRRIPALGRSIAGTDDSTALLQNPANLAFMPSAELRWSGVFLDETNQVPWQGHAFALAFPLPFIPIATGFRLDVVDPPSAMTRVPEAGGSANYQWLTWGLAIGSSETTALGVSLQGSYSDKPQSDSLGSFSIGYSGRPFSALGFSLVANDLTAPTNSAGGRIDRSFDIALAIRPLGTRAIELGLEGKYVDREDDYWTPRATLGVDLPPIGRLRGDFSMSHPDDASRREWLASAALAVHFNTPSGSTELAGGAVTGTTLGVDGSYGVVADAAFRGWRETAGIEAPRYALRVRIEDTPGPRAHVALLRRLWRLAEEPTADAVVLELRDAPAGSLAHVQELRDAVQHLRKSGKRVLCHLEDASGSELYLCSAANKIYMNPAGGLRFAGLKTTHLYFANLLSKLGIRADFVRIGAHKSAPERFTRTGSSDVARADAIDLLQQTERQFVEGVASGRRVPVAELRKRIAQGPFVAPEALSAGLIDGYAFDDQIEEKLRELLRRDVVLLDDDPAKRVPKAFGRKREVAIVYVDGDMVDGRSQTIPFLGTRLVGSYTIAEQLKSLRENPNVGAIVLRVETPGGSAMAADVIWRQVQLTAKVKPVVVSMGSYAASGGYYIASPGTRVFANGMTITGSIGIFYGKADVSELLKKIGVSTETYKTAPRADAESLFRPFSEEEKQELQRKVGQFYDVFLSRVAQGRGITKAEVDKVGQGRVWTGEQAQARRLVDEIGGLRQALAYARREAGLPDTAPISEHPPPDTTLLGKILGIEGVSEHTQLKLPASLLQLARALGPFLVHPADKPMARLDVTPVTQ
jgi:protease IV